MAAAKFTALLIAGPTASGKSALALRLAEKLGGILINADSMQVYRDLRILSARPSAEEELRAPHRLFGAIDGAVNFSVGLWLEAARNILEEARQAGALPIFVGGTGLYFKALTQGLSDIPAVPDDIRAKLRARTEGVAATELHAELSARDPLMAARLRPSDPQRLLRALEVLEATGRSLASFQSRRGPPVLDPAATRAIFLSPERAALNLRIDERFEAMLASGAWAEVEALRRRGLDPALPLMRAHGVPHLIAHLEGKIPQDEAIRLGKRDTRAYARRQFTFARHQLPGFVWAEPREAEALALA
ncbi:tRNA delta(2)-isopentenylpyrophosphate transferase [Methylocella silvestris BL2]|uniref:tRNA dimethylallyltransferase n=1 Tax=Methylocella silvestris (strain DSM 15510 / CIP 108128 / LMG 27833 / NCIMB 13906 / BL2) TaxID=395965 RepID=MIAA_METSB|nr:tRNA (adenosine(37)-N6)-dimethylallyltransferase MiaA [Methylocella silvestris]B8EQB8.1 RecName: Full=tRNA dimethylallyltransferase; AltName: Full=Dimethylallyl diphosphate:tRNA dimethylallyltransferase; Short=DMAPP:tRNA dimethylallyltransferase; Short=DMATase; AltName: Full=Isopentenyl-diphosphate:tRNA isopentenyltransferase; Short=IPP transferase; Short=IPPT; Short=IPTase [Methylocella silvestris BL2]ACK52131.1 tRNA delta(2)-isopentenylpyrophosphate transferase [Methylocella silvestris BL2]